MASYGNPNVRLGNWVNESAWQNSPSAAAAAAASAARAAEDQRLSNSRGRREPRTASEELHRHSGHHPSHITDWGRTDKAEADVGRIGPKPSRRAPAVPTHPPEGVSQLLAEPHEADQARCAAAALREALTPWATDSARMSPQGRRKAALAERAPPFAREGGADASLTEPRTYDLVYEGSAMMGRRHSGSHSPYSAHQAELAPGSRRQDPRYQQPYPEQLKPAPPTSAPPPGSAASAGSEAAVASAAAGLASLSVDAEASATAELRLSMTQLGSWLHDRGILASRHFGRYDLTGDGVVSPPDFLRSLRAAGATANPLMLRALPAGALTAGGVRYSELDALLLDAERPPTDSIRSVDFVVTLPSSVRGRSSAVRPSSLAGGGALLPGAAEGAVRASATAHAEREHASRLRRELMRRYRGLGISARELWATLDVSAQGTVSEDALAAGLQRMSLAPGTADAAALASMLCGGVSGLGWTQWSAFLSEGEEEVPPAERRRRLTVTRQLGAMKATLGRHARALETELRAADDGSGVVPLPAFALAVQRCGVLMAPQDYARVALHLDPDGGGRWVRYGPLLAELR
jgi:hypothetical protein